MNILLGVSGSIASYRAADLARDFMRAGHTVRVCLTDAASKFVTPALFEALTGQPCLTGVFEEPVTGEMAHITWARWADLVVVAPATANTLNKLAVGVGDDMLTTICLAATCPIIVAPAMNPTMYAQNTVQEALTTLSQRGVRVVEPESGDVACGENGQGKLAANNIIVRTAEELLSRKKILLGKNVLITSGPTQEPIDSVRFLTNRSSGKMGAAMATAALELGATVTIVAGPQVAKLPDGAHVIRVQTARQMLEAALEAATNMDYIFGVAAVADYHVAEVFDGKLRRADEELILRLTPNPDIISAIASANQTAITVAFAAEPNEDLGYAISKMERKGVFAIALNDISKSGIGFESDKNALTLLFRDGKKVEIPSNSKLQCARQLFDALLG